MTQGTGPTKGLIFAMATHGGIHTYSDTASSIGPSHLHEYRHSNMQSRWFLSRISLSPCGRWLAAGSEEENAFLYDVSNAHAISTYAGRSDIIEHATRAVEICEPSDYLILSVDWAHGGTLATSSSGGHVRIWRPDDDTMEMLRHDPKSAWRHWAYTTDVADGLGWIEMSQNN